MKISFEGSVTKAQILASLEEALTGLEEAGIDSFKGVNLYLNTYKGKKRAYAVDDNLNEVSITLRNIGTSHPNRDVTSSYVFQFYRDLKFFSKGELVDLQEEAKAERIEAERKRLERAKAELDRKNAEKDHQIWLKSEVISQVKALLGLDDMTFKGHLISIGPIKTQQGLSSYTDEALPLPAMRCTLKIPNHDTKSVFLFDQQANLTLQINDFTSP